jgi:hypothetical protein
VHNPLIVAVVLVVILALAAAVVRLLVGARGSRARDEDGFAYDTQDLLSGAERSFYGVLEQVLGGQYRIFAKVRLSDLLKPRSWPSGSTRQGALNKINSKHVDFVLCAPDDLSVICAIELDDASHSRRDREARDEELDGAFRSASLPLVRFPVQRGYVVSEVRAALAGVAPLAATNGSDSPQPLTNPAPLSPPQCPKCSKPMLRRTSQKGEYAGKPFWGCSGYPKCRSILPIDPQEQAP